MSIYKNLPRFEFGAMRGGGCDVSFLQAAGNMGIMKRLIDRVLFCIAYKLVHQPFFGLKISSQVLTAFEYISWAVFAIWTASSEFGTYRLCKQRRFRRACASAQSRQNLRCSLIQAVNQEELSDRKPDPWPL